MNFTELIVQNFNEFLTYTGFANATSGNLIMIVVGIFFIWLAIKKDFEPLLDRDGILRWYSWESVL